MFPPPPPLLLIEVKIEMPLSHVMLSNYLYHHGLNLSLFYLFLFPIDQLHL